MTTATTAPRTAPSARFAATAGDTPNVLVTIHTEDGTWWADSPTIPGFYAMADTRQELLHEVRESLEFAADDLEDVTLSEAIRTGVFVLTAKDEGTTSLALGA